MCLIGFALHAHPRYPLILAANRDEFHERPTRRAGFWPESPGLLGGRDELAGGSWLAMDTLGRVAAVTNYREARPRSRDKRSRGGLVTEFLESGRDASEYAHAVDRRGHEYSGFSLLVYDASGGWFVSNRDGKPSAITAGVHALSNHLLDTPWPKVSRMHRALARETGSVRPDARRLLEALLDTSPADPEELPDTGVGRPLERMLSPPFVLDDRYGTRCATILLIDGAGRVHFEEHGFGPAGEAIRARRFGFTRHGRVVR